MHNTLARAIIKSVLLMISLKHTESKKKSYNAFITKWHDGVKNFGRGLQALLGPRGPVSDLFRQPIGPSSKRML